MLKIDGEWYDVPVLSLHRKAEFLDKYANRTEDGVLHRELIGTYLNFQLKLGNGDSGEYQRLWNKLTEPDEFHLVTVPEGERSFTFMAYFSNVGDSLLRTYQGKPYWTGLTVNFIARSPARR
ncbi:MAG: hypothetical protein RR022_08350 [Angelakisella sp.]